MLPLYHVRTFFVIVIFGTIMPARQAFGSDLADTVESLQPAVVTVVAYDTVESPRPSSTGTGFFVDSGHIVTNWHVIRGAAKLEFYDHAGDTHSIPAVAGTDRVRDLAALVPEKAYKPKASVRIADEKPRVGTRIYVLGSPLGLDHTLSDGLVSSFRDHNEGEWLQITAAISPGSSGSPVFDVDGNVYGVATFTLVKGQSLNFAVPVTYVEDLLDDDPRDVSEATVDAESNSGARPEQPNADIDQRLYQFYAATYMREIENQGRRRPLLVFGRRSGSVGHIDRNVRILQVLSDTTALLQLLDKRGRSIRTIRVTGVDLTNFSDGEITSFDEGTILSQLTTYRYESVGAGTMTVYSVQALDRKRFRDALQEHFDGPSGQLTKTVEERNAARANVARIENRIEKTKSQSKDIERARYLRRQIQMYRSVMDRENIRKLVEGMREELEELGVTSKELVKYDIELSNLADKKRDAENRLRHLQQKVQMLQKQLPSILDETRSR